MFSQDFQEFLELLTKHGADFMVIGGYAYSLNVDFRYTKDLDIWVRPTKENLECVNNATEQFIGTRFDPNEILRLLQTSRLGFRLCGIEPNIIEILLRVKGVEFDAAFARSIKAPMGNIEVHIIHPYDQIQNKRAAGSPKDLLDAENLVKRYGEPK